MDEPFVSRALKIALWAIFALGSVGTATLPLTLDIYMIYFYDAYHLQSGYRAFILIFLMVAAILGLWVVWEMIRIMNSVPNNPFVLRNVSSLQRIGLLLLILSGLFFGKCFLYVTFLTAVCGLLFLVCALFAFTLCNLFRQAVAFKEENDLTI